MKSLFFVKCLTAKVIGVTLLYLAGITLAKKFETYHEEETK